MILAEEKNNRYTMMSNRRGRFGRWRRDDYEESCSSSGNRSLRPSRRWNAKASALLACCAVASFTSSSDPSIYRLLYRRLAADDSTSASSPSSSSSPAPPVTGVRTSVLFIPVEPFLKDNNKMNAHFSLQEYAEGLSRTCEFLSKLDHPVSILGDQEWIQENAPDCRELGDAPSGGNYALDDLNHQAGAAMVQRHMCRKKFATDKHDPRRILREHVLVYLNKLDILCNLAQESPNELTVLVDADIDPDLWETVEALIEKRVAEPADASLTVYEHPYHGYRSWFGRPSCREHPTANTEFMAIRGKDCPAIRQSFNETVVKYTDIAAPVPLLPDAGPCPCFDDEMILHYIVEEYDNGKDMVSFYGVPRVVPQDDDDSMWDENALLESFVAAYESEEDEDDVDIDEDEERSVKFNRL